MYKRVYFLLLVSVFLFTSCEDAGTTFTGVVNSPPSYSNNLSGYGCSGNTLCYPLEEIFYDLDSEVEQDYYKYNSIDIVTNDFSPDNILTLKTFGDEYLYNVPITSVYSYCDDYSSENQSEEAWRSLGLKPVDSGSQWRLLFCILLAVGKENL